MVKHKLKRKLSDRNRRMLLIFRVANLLADALASFVMKGQRVTMQDRSLLALTWVKHSASSWNTMPLADGTVRCHWNRWSFPKRSAWRNHDGIDVVGQSGIVLGSERMSQAGAVMAVAKMFQNGIGVPECSRLEWPVCAACLGSSALTVDVNAVSQSAAALSRHIRILPIVSEFVTIQSRAAPRPPSHQRNGMGKRFANCGRSSAASWTN